MDGLIMLREARESPTWATSEPASRRASRKAMRASEEISIRSRTLRLRSRSSSASAVAISIRKYSVPPAR